MKSDFHIKQRMRQMMDFAKMPLVFEANEGQLDSRAAASVTAR